MSQKYFNHSIKYHNNIHSFRILTKIIKRKKSNIDNDIHPFLFILFSPTPDPEQSLVSLQSELDQSANPILIQTGISEIQSVPQTAAQQTTSQM